MPGKSPFAEDWRDCLQAHYMHVIRVDDTRTEKTLRTVLYECGFNDGDLKTWYVLATMHVDAVPPDFVPDLEQVETFAAVAVPAAEPPVVEVEPLPEEAAAPPEDVEEMPPYDPNGFQQLSLF